VFKVIESFLDCQKDTQGQDQSPLSLPLKGTQIKLPPSKVFWPVEEK